MAKHEPPVTSFRLENLLTLAADRMKADLRERLIAHPGELGTDREEVIRSFLRAYLPKRFEVSTGFVFDVNGTVSMLAGLRKGAFLVFECAHLLFEGVLPLWALLVSTSKTARHFRRCLCARLWSGDGRHVQRHGFARRRCSIRRLAIH